MQNGASPTPNQSGILESEETLCCPDCKSANFDESIPEVDAVCNDCGLVIEDFANLQFPLDKEVSHQIEAKPVNWSEYYTVTNSTEQRIAFAFECLETFSECLDLDSDVRQQAAALYSEAALLKLTDGRPTQVVVAGAVALGARKVGRPIPVVRIATAADVHVQALNHFIRILSCDLGQSPGLCMPEAYLSYLCRDLGLRDKIESQARKRLESIQDVGLFVGANPAGVAGAALYLAANGQVTQRQIATAAGVSGETIRIRVADCRKALENP